MLNIKITKILKQSDELPDKNKKKTFGSLVDGDSTSILLVVELGFLRERNTICNIFVQQIELKLQVRYPSVTVN